MRRVDETREIQARDGRTCGGGVAASADGVVHVFFSSCSRKKKCKLAKEFTSRPKTKDKEMTSLAAPSRAAFGSSAVHTARLKTPQRCPLALPETSRPKARASKGQTPPPSARSSASSFKTTIARASRDALSSSLSDEEQGALDAFVASGGDVAKAKALMVEAATTKVRSRRRRQRPRRRRERLIDFFFSPLQQRKNSTLVRFPLFRPP